MDFAINEWEDLGNVATVITAVVAVFSAGFLLGQISSQARVTREVKAVEAWDSYLRLCVERPELSSEATFQRSHGRLPNVDYKMNDKEDERYLWFLSTLLNAGEQIILNSPTWRNWKRAIADQISYHAETMKQVWYRGPDGARESGWVNHYSNRMQRIVQSVIGGPELVDGAAA